MSILSVERGAKYQVEIRRTSGGSQCVMLQFFHVAALKMTIGDLKELLCMPPHCLCTRTAHLELVKNGKLLSDGSALLDVLQAEVTRITAVTIVVAAPREGSIPANHALSATACNAWDTSPLPIAQAPSSTEHKRHTDVFPEAAAQEIIPNFFEEESSVFGKDKVLSAFEHIIRTQYGVEDASQRRGLAEAFFGGAISEDAKAALSHISKQTPKTAAWQSDAKASFREATKDAEDAETKQFLLEAEKSYCVDRQQLKELNCINWLEVQQFYRNCVADDGSFDVCELPSGVSDVHIKYFAYADETKKRLVKNFPSRKDIQSLGQSMNEVRGGSWHFLFNEFRSKRFVIQNSEKEWLIGCEGVVDSLGSVATFAHAAPAVGLCLYWPPGAVTRNGGERLCVQQENLALCDTAFMDKEFEKIKSSPESAEMLRFWGEVQQFYRIHVAGDGSFDPLRLPCGVSELNVKYFAAWKHVYFPKIVQESPQKLRLLLSSMDTVDTFRFFFAAEQHGSTGEKIVGTRPVAFKDLCSGMIDEFRAERFTICGLKNAAWLNGAECIADDYPSLQQSSRASVRLYWPPDAVTKNGGKMASISTSNLNRDYEYISEKMPELFVGLVNQAVDRFKGTDPICRIFLSLIDFSQVPGWYEPATMHRITQIDIQSLERQFERDFAESPQFCEKFQQSRGLGLGFWCCIEIFPDLQDEINKAISHLSDSDAETCTKSLLQAVDLISVSDTHIIDKMECWFFSAILGKKSYMLSMYARPFGAAAAAKFTDFLQSQWQSDSNFSEIQLEMKKKLNRLLELLIFLIFQDTKEALHVISNRQFLVGVIRQSGGSFLLHLLSVFTVKCAQEMAGADSQIDWASFKAMDATGIALHFPATVAVLLHRAISAHAANCSCIKDSLPCNWPSHIKEYLLTYQLFRNMDSRHRLRRIFGHPDVLFQLKPRILDRPIQSIVLVKFALKMCMLDLSTRDNVVETSLLQFIEEDLRKEALGRAILVADTDAAAVIGCFFQAEELDCMRRYTSTRSEDVTSIPVRVHSMKNSVWMNGAHGCSNLIPDSNGFVLVHVLSPADVAAMCKPPGVAKLKPANLEVLGMDISASLIAQLVGYVQKFSLDPILRIAAVVIENQLGAAAGEPLKFLRGLRDSFENIPRLVPFFSTIKQFFSKLFPGFVQMFFRFLNPLTRRQVLEHLFVQFGVLTSIVLPPDVMENINAKYSEFMDSDAFKLKVLPNLQQLGRNLERFSNISSYYADLMNFFTDYKSEGGDMMGPLAGGFSWGSFQEQFLPTMQQAFPEYSAGFNLFQKLNISQLQEDHRQFVQSGMSSSAAPLAAFEKMLSAAGPEVMLITQDSKAHEFLELVNSLTNPARARHFHEMQDDALGRSDSDFGTFSDEDEDPISADISDGQSLALEQRVRVKAGCTHEFLTGAEGIVLKLPFAGSESYGVLVQKPTSAWLRCEEGCLQYIEKKDLMILGKCLLNHNHATEWVDEQDCLISKKVLYCTTCPKAHALQFGPPLNADDRINFCTMCESDLGSQSRFSCSRGCVYSICQACHDAVNNPGAGTSSFHHGDEFAYIHGIKISALQAFKERWQHTYKSMSTHQFNQMVMKPRTIILKTSYVNCLLQQPSTSNYVGNANWFISHSWNAAISDTIDSVLDFFYSQEQSFNDVVVWFDIFCTSQHNSGAVPRPSSWYMTTFRSAIANMGSLLLSIDNWRDPKPLERAWCILELHAISSKISDSGGRFEITMPAHSRESFLRATSADVSKYFSLLSSVSAEQSTCSRDVDKESIHNAIRDSIGFDSLNRSIYSVMTNWVIAQIQAFSCGMKDANEMAMVQRMKALGIILCETGRYEQALFVFQEASKTWSTFRNVAPLSLGTDVNSVDSQISRQIIRIHVHLGQYALAQQFHDEAIKRCSETRNLRIFHTFGIDMDELANTFPAEPGTADFDIVDTSDQLNFYHRLIFSDADDPEFLEACGLSNVDYGKLQSAMDDPHLNLQLKITSFQIKINRLPAKHPWIASAMLRLAHAHFEVDQCEEALPLLRRALPFLRRLPLCHPNVILALLLLSACLIKDGALSHAASAAEEAQTLCKKAAGVFADAIALPVELVSAAEQAVVLCRDASFQLNLSSENSNVSNCCIAQFIAVIKNIGTDEARMERVIINRGRDAADQVLERIMPKVQTAMDEKQKAEGGPVIDVRQFFAHKKKSQSLAKQELQQGAAAPRDAPKSETECDISSP